LSDFVTASQAATILSSKMGHRIDPSYIHKLKDIRFVKLNNTSKLYNKYDIENVVIRQKRTK